jgi:hypothetical protein
VSITCTHVVLEITGSTGYACMLAVGECYVVTTYSSSLSGCHCIVGYAVLLCGIKFTLCHTHPVCRYHTEVYEGCLDTREELDGSLHIIMVKVTGYSLLLNNS